MKRKNTRRIDFFHTYIMFCCSFTVQTARLTVFIAYGIQNGAVNVFLQHTKNVCGRGNYQNDTVVEKERV